MEKYTIRVTTKCGLYKDYEVEAANVFFAKILAREKFLKEFNGADEDLKFSIINPSKKTLKEILNELAESIEEDEYEE